MLRCGKQGLEPLRRRPSLDNLEPFAAESCQF
jgi:hypothetical protein